MALKEHLGRPPLLSKPIEGENFYLYLAVYEEAVSDTLVIEEEKVQCPIYFVSKRLLDAEIRYPELEKLALALMVTSRKLRSYFHAYLIEVLPNYPLCQVLQKSEASSRLLKWAIKLGQFEVNFCPQTVIEGQALADLIAEFTYSNIVEVTGTTNNTEVAKATGVMEKENSVPTKRDAE